MNNTTGLKVSSFFRAEDVLAGIGTRDRDAALRLMVEALAADGRIKDAEQVLKMVIDRENLLPTQLAVGLAIPHARLEELSDLTIAVATSREGINFQAESGVTARVVVLILTPVSQPGLYLQALAAIANLMGDPGVIDKVVRLKEAKHVWEFFDKGASTLPSYVTAHDMMAQDYPTLRNTDYLEMAIDVFVHNHVYDIPVVDEDGDLVGVMNEERLLKLALPEYILWLEDLSPILHFEPFAEILRDEKTLRVAEVMSSEFASVPEDAPAIQVAKILMRLEVRAVMVTTGKKLAGVITLSDFLTRVLRK